MLKEALCNDDRASDQQRTAISALNSAAAAASPGLEALVAESRDALAHDTTESHRV